MLQGNRSIPAGGGGNGNITPMPMEFLIYVYFEYREEMSRLAKRHSLMPWKGPGPFGATYDQMRHRYERWRKWLLPLQEVSGLAGWTNIRFEEGYEMEAGRHRQEEEEGWSTGRRRRRRRLVDIDGDGKQEIFDFRKSRSMEKMLEERILGEKEACSSKG
ncbi:hypothetical protein L6452_17663 [Arctium lappa]|uniref:Uncharacterized protein n=1 Tax=Arctium lappa TaxID=4217 RepID=A0ACB9C3W6_ARCLA|nr:hypothetical protein L6452_17663 [Arctium lappa]